MEMEGAMVEDRRREIGGHRHVSSKLIRKRKVRKRLSSTQTTANSTTTPATTTTTRTSLSRLSINREPHVSSPLQRLYTCCKNVFKGRGFVPSAQDVQSLCKILDGMRLEDLGLSSELQFFKPGNRVVKNPRVICTTVYECPKKNFSMVLFFLPASTVIPLHNHPEMTVLSKLLVGSMHIKAYDWADSVDVKHPEQPSQLRLAKLKANSVFTAPCDTSVLYPTSGGNIHEFTALTPCAVLDVLGPPYSKKDGRDCSFYKDIAYQSSDGPIVDLKDDKHSYAWLEEIGEPEQSKMDCVKYSGPPVMETAS